MKLHTADFFENGKKFHGVFIETGDEMKILKYQKVRRLFKKTLKLVFQYTISNYLPYDEKCDII
jgi:hypothetical protein